MNLAMFDWNGTLFNDMRLIIRAVIKVFDHFGKAPPSYNEYCLEYAGGLKSKDYMDVYRCRGINASREEINSLFIPEYKRLVKSAQLFSYALNTLELLDRLGITLCLITGNPEDLTMPYLKKFGLNKLFSHCIFESRDKTEAIRDLIKENGANSSKCFYLGDLPSDMRDALKAGVTPVAFIPWQELRGAMLGAMVGDRSGLISVCVVNSWEYLVPTLQECDLI